MTIWSMTTRGNHKMITALIVIHVHLNHHCLGLGVYVRAIWSCTRNGHISLRIDLHDTLTCWRRSKLWQAIIVLSLHSGHIFLAKVLRGWFLIQLLLLVSIRVDGLFKLAFFLFKFLKFLHVLDQLLALLISFGLIDNCLATAMCIVCHPVMVKLQLRTHILQKILLSRWFFHLNIMVDISIQVILIHHHVGIVGSNLTAMRGNGCASDRLSSPVSTSRLHQHWTKDFLGRGHLEKCLRCACHLWAEWLVLVACGLSRLLR